MRHLDSELSFRLNHDLLARHSFLGGVGRWVLVLIGIDLVDMREKMTQEMSVELETQDD